MPRHKPRSAHSKSNIPPHVPLKIKIKREKEEKALDINNKNWFRGIEIEVTNTSEKPIYFLSLDIELVDLAQTVQTLRVFLLSYGRGEFIEQNTKPIPEDLPIEPKATHTFIIDEIQRNGLRTGGRRTTGETH